MRSVALALVAALAIGPSPSPGQETTFEANVDLVRVHVAVTDDEGRHVPGLEAGGFDLFVDGELRQVELALEVQDAGEAGLPLGKAAAGGSPWGARRKVVLLLDLERETAVSWQRARNAARVFVNSYMRETDLVSIVLFSSRAGAVQAVPFTSNRALLRATIEAAGSAAHLAAEDMSLAPDLLDVVDVTSPLDSPTANLGEEPSPELRRRNTEFLRAVGVVARMGSGIPGPTQLLLFSKGIPDQVFRRSDVLLDTERAVDALRAGNTVLHAFDSDRIPTWTVHDVTEMTSTVNLQDLSGSLRASQGMRATGHESLGFLSAETGGAFARYQHNVGAGLEEFDRRTSSFYVLGFRRRPSDPVGARIEVRCRCGAAEVWQLGTRQLGPVTTRTNLSPEARRNQLSAALTAGVDLEEIDARIQIYEDHRASDGRARFALALEVPEAGLPPIPSPAESTTPGRRVELIASLIDAASGQIVDALRYATSLPAGEAETTLRYQGVFEVPPGTYDLAAVIRDAATGAMWSRHRAVSVGAVDSGPRIVGPVLLAASQGTQFVLDRSFRLSLAEPRDDGSLMTTALRVGTSQFAADLSGTIAAGQEIRLWLAAHGLNPGAEGGVPAVVVDLDDDEGRSIALEDLRLLAVHTGHEQTAQFVVAGRLGPRVRVGPAAVRVRVTDVASSARLEGMLDVLVVPPEGLP